ncbi:sonic hedgehog protein-like [Branchiostoma floridae]|uniref:Sonic hedgehog protein-like n=1 Tax=Branchiostoma floridae TaxID=7739 RepID=C3YRC4_BRAFL|nr:sonic hedgehog protein-like [Branchiostoma floridae]|eukprot:XP_002601109.1 hypothetical protein BRAFLDRAFT_75558 [Branchiostoma floridae]
MAQGNKSARSEQYRIIVPEENSSLGSTAQGYPYGAQERYTPYQPRENAFNYQEPSSGCFHGQTSVHLIDGSTRAMQDLKLGDWVQVFTSDRSLAYRPIMAMLDREPDKKNIFQQINVEGKNGPVCLTLDHLIYATKNPQERLESPIFARNVKEGMFVFLVDEKSGKVVPAKVLDVSEVELCGYLAPLTTEGTIMADGIAASCYANFDHELSHIAFWPLRLKYWLKSALGIGGKEKKVAKVGIHGYAKALMKVNNFMFHVQPSTAVAV